jgi:hypothetical protein
LLGDISVGSGDEPQRLSSNSLGNSILGGAKMASSAYGAYKQAKYYDALSDKLKAPTQDDPINSARGGKIARVAGKPIGKDDGLIPAQKGEYVVRKSAVKKLGTGVLNTINKGRLPKAGTRR